MRHQSIESYFDPLGFHEFACNGRYKRLTIGCCKSLAWLDLNNRQDLHRVVDNFAIDVEKSHGK